MEFKYDDILWELNDGPWWDWKDASKEGSEKINAKQGCKKMDKNNEEEKDE